nr:immunoglobulin light chain junction region [Macaca mulatta]MOX26770.1 immunoglobulin light chain junction region [Macaca mulatta]
CLQHNGSPFTF